MKYVNISDDESDVDLDEQYIFVDNYYHIPTDENSTFISRYINKESVNRITKNVKKTTSIIKTELFEILKDLSSFENRSSYLSSFLD